MPALDETGGQSVETQLVALHVLHHEARLVDAISSQKAHARRAEIDQSCALRLEHGQALFADKSATDPHVEMQPVLDDLAYRDALEEQPRAYT